MLLQTLTVHLISSSWLANFHDFAIFTLGASALGTCLMGGCCGVVMYIHPSTFTSSKKLEELGGRDFYASPLRMIWFTVSFIFWEWIKSTGFLAYPWGTLPIAAYRWKIITQVASLTGVWGISFLFALFSSFIGESIFFCLNVYDSPVPAKLLTTWRTEGKTVLVLFAITAVYGAVEYYMPRTPVKTVNTVIVQQNADPWNPESDSVAISMKLTEDAVKRFRENEITPDLVLWSEGVLESSYPDDAPYYYSMHPAEESLSNFIQRMNVPFIMGGRVTLNKSKRRYGNAAVLYDRGGNYAGFYNKMHLVPFAERLPYPDNPLVKELIHFLVGFSYGWTPGNQYVLFETPILSKRAGNTPLEYRDKPFQILSLRKNGYYDPDVTENFMKGDGTNPDTSIRFSTPICFEDAFTDVCRPLFNSGSEVFMNITNDSWSETASAEYQHFIAASYLAIEFRSTLVRCTNAGYSAVVDPSGRIRDDLPLFKQTSLCAEVPVYDRIQTVYAEYGDWFAYMCVAFVILYALSVLWSLMFSGTSRPEHITVTFSRREDDYYEDDCDLEEDYEYQSVSDEKTSALTASKTESSVKKSVVSAAKTAADKNKKTAGQAKNVSASVKKTSVRSEKASASEKKPSVQQKKNSGTARKTDSQAKKVPASGIKASGAAKKAAGQSKKVPVSGKKASGTARNAGRQAKNVTDSGKKASGTARKAAGSAKKQAKSAVQAKNK